MKKNEYKYVIGIDEAGRGALSGPVSVAAVAVEVSRGNCRASSIKRQVPGVPLRDSKKLSPKQREIWFRHLSCQPKLFYALSMVSPGVIDKINVSQAANLAATRALKQLITNNKRLTTKNSPIFLDGGLFIKKSLVESRKLSVSTIVRGDEKIPAIMLASIFAKVKRDRLMVRLHRKFPEYEFSRHKGYGTKRHIKAIRKFGLSPVHRQTFGNFETKSRRKRNKSLKD